MDSDPVVLRLSGDNLDGDFLDPLGGKPLSMIVIVSDTNSEEGMPLLDFGNSILQHVFGDIPLDPGYYGHD